MKKKICIYTCITGDYDDVKEVMVKDNEVDYYLFTNNRKIKSNCWNVIYIENDGLDNIRLARKIKVLGHSILKEYDINVWIDGASYLRGSVAEFIQEYCDLKKYSLIGFQHRERDCIYDEALECVKVRKEKKEVILQQMNFYRKNGYPEHNGLIESTVLVRRNNDNNLDKTMKKWFEEICKFSYRDQLSFNYVAKECNLKYLLLSMNVFDNEYFGWEKHPSKKVLEGYSVYFGEDQDFDYNSLFLGTYEKNGDKFTAKFKCSKKCNVFKIEFANCSGILFSNLVVHGSGIEKQNLVNYSQYFEDTIFDFGIPTLFLYGNFKKGQFIEVSLKMKFMSEDEYLKLLKRFNITLIQTLEQIHSKKNIIYQIRKKFKK